MASNWTEIEAGLDELLALPVSRRDAALDRLAAGKPELRAELLSLIAHAEGEDSLLDRPAAIALATDHAAATLPTGSGSRSASLLSGQRIGAYRVLELIGRGGMGEVYRAERADGQFEQQVALKLIAREAEAHLSRFEAERQILARLEHPGIARLYDGGMTEDRRPYMVMELVIGQPITQWCRQRRCNLAQRLRLFMEVCDAVAHAHRNLLVHRDLKPENVMVSEDGVVKLLDFGVARPISTLGDEQTRTAPLTLAYAAPEQLTGGTVTTAVDVYALGMVLFELLTGERPWHLAELAPAIALNKVLAETPRPPSRVAAQRGDQAPVAMRELRGDLDAIVAKAVRKGPASRYESVSALSQDIARSLAGQPVTAREGARMYVLCRWLVRYRVLVGSAAMVMIAVVAGVVGVLHQSLRAEQQAQRATAAKDFLISIFDSNRIDATESLRTATAEQLLQRGAERIGLELKDQPELRAELLGVIGNLYSGMELAGPAIPLLQQRVDSLKVLRGTQPDAELAGAMIDLGLTLSVSRNFESADEHLLAGLQMLDLLDDRTSLNRATALDGLAHSASLQRPTSDPTARNYLTEALDILRRHHPDDQMNLRLLLGAARIATNQGDLADAEALMLQALEFSGRNPDSTPRANVASVEAEYARLLFSMRRLKEAESRTIRAVELFALCCGPRHPLTLDAEVTLARIMAATGRFSEAQDRLWAAFRTLQSEVGAEDLSWTAGARTALIRVMMIRGDLESAAPLVEQGIAIFRQAAADQLCLTHLPSFKTRLLILEGNLAEAERVIAECRDALSTFNDRDPRRQRALLSEAEYFMARPDAADIAQASELFGRVATSLASTPDSEARMEAALGVARARLGASAITEALQLAQAHMRGILDRPASGELPLEEADARMVMGQALLMDGQPEKALDHLERAVSLREAIDVADSPWLARFRVALARCYFRLGRRSEASALLVRAQPAYARYPGAGQSPIHSLPKPQDHSLHTHRR